MGWDVKNAWINSESEENSIVNKSSREDSSHLERCENSTKPILAEFLAIFSGKKHYLWEFAVMNSDYSDPPKIEKIFGWIPDK